MGFRMYFGEFALKFSITPWSIGWVTLVVFASRKQIYFTTDLTTLYWDDTLHCLKSRYAFLHLHLLIRVFNHSFIIFKSVHAFLLECHTTVWVDIWTFFKHLCLWAFPITSGFSCFPSVNPYIRMINLSFNCFSHHIVFPSVLICYLAKREKTHLKFKKIH